MKLAIKASQLLKLLVPLNGVVEKKHILPILANIKFDLSMSALVVTASDTEVEMVGILQLADGMCQQEGVITMSARKLIDICKSLADAPITMHLEEEKCIIKSGKSKFVLGTLPAADFPYLNANVSNANCITIGQAALKNQLDKTMFSMALQDVRFYLTGMLFEAFDGLLRTVSTDGHRLSMSESEATIVGQDVKAVVPRKAVQELQKLLLPTDEQTVNIQISPQFLHLVIDMPHLETEQPIELRFTTKLIEGEYPDYRRVMPQNGDKTLVVNRKDFKESLQRVAILGNESLISAFIKADSNSINISATNVAQDKADDTLDAKLTGDTSLEVAFNVNYILDILNVLAGENIDLTFTGSHSTALIHDPADARSIFVVMPIRL